MNGSRLNLVASLLLIALCCGACASHPKMDAGAPLKVRRGYWVLPTDFEQRDHLVDRGSVKERLSQRKASASAVSRGAAFDIAARLTAVASGFCLGWGLSRLVKNERGSAQTGTTGLFLAGAGSLGLSITFGVAAEGAFISAVDEYNAPYRSNKNE